MNEDYSKICTKTILCSIVLPPAGIDNHINMKIIDFHSMDVHAARQTAGCA